MLFARLLSQACLMLCGKTMTDEKNKQEGPQEDNEGRPNDLFRVVNRKNNHRYLVMDSYQLTQFMFCLDYLLRPQIAYQFDNEAMMKELLKRNFAMATFLLSEVRKLHQEGDPIREQLDMIWRNLDEDKQQAGLKFRQKLDILLEHGHGWGI